MQLITYSPLYAEQWNSLVSCSRNGTFLFLRQFMDYHADRFDDVSLIFYKGTSALNEETNSGEYIGDAECSNYKNIQPLGILPASAHGKDVVSHGGLTYGGLILSPSAHATDVGEMLALAMEHYKRCGFKKLVLKPVPYIYHSQPADDELYWLFRQGAKLVSRSLSTSILLDAPLPFSTLRKRKVKKATREGVQIEQTTATKDYKVFWELLAEVLMQQHGKSPVHSLEEIILLRDLFPHNIQLYVVREASSGNILAGTLLFISPQVVHAQYIASSICGREIGALDCLFHHLVDEFASTSHRYFDFGISTEDHGSWLNEGLNFQKEGFGGRSVVYDTYTLTLCN